MIAQSPRTELREDSLIGCRDTGDEDNEGEENTANDEVKTKLDALKDPEP